MKHQTTQATQAKQPVRTQRFLSAATLDSSEPCIIEQALHKVVKDSDCHLSHFETTASNLAAHGYSIQKNVLPTALATLLMQHVQALPQEKFKGAAVGRKKKRTLNSAVRSDAISWIDGVTPVGKLWLEWSAQLQEYLNAELFAGLRRFESHFAHYSPGDFYKTHFDAFKGQANRKLSLIVYLNENWQDHEGGELELHISADEKIKVAPQFGTLVTFLSEDFAHQVLPATRDRYSIAGWFRVDNPLQPLPVLL